MGMLTPSTRMTVMNVPDMNMLMPGPAGRFHPMGMGVRMDMHMRRRKPKERDGMSDHEQQTC